MDYPVELALAGSRYVPLPSEYPGNCFPQPRLGQLVGLSDGLGPSDNAPDDGNSTRADLDHVRQEFQGLGTMGDRQPSGQAATGQRQRTPMDRGTGRYTGFGGYFSSAEFSFRLYPATGPCL